MVRGEIPRRRWAASNPARSSPSGGCAMPTSCVVGRLSRSLSTSIQSRGHVVCKWLVRGCVNALVTGQRAQGGQMPSDLRKRLGTRRAYCSTKSALAGSPLRQILCPGVCEISALSVGVFLRPAHLGLGAAPLPAQQLLDLGGLLEH